MDFCAARERIHGLSIDPLFYYAVPFLRLLWVLLLFLLLAQATVGTLVICYVFSYPGKIKKTTRQKKTKKTKKKDKKRVSYCGARTVCTFPMFFSGVFLIAHGLCSKVSFFAQLFNPCLQWTTTSSFHISSLWSIPVTTLPLARPGLKVVLVQTLFLQAVLCRHFAA